MKSQKPIRLLVMDVDGTLTDGQIYMSAQGELMKAFHVKDGYGIRNLLPKKQIIPVIITGRTSAIVENRCRELEIRYLYQGVEQKDACLKRVSEELSIPLEQAACMGDDENDLPMMRLCGVCGCPVDAADAVKKQCVFTSTYAGGHGAVREFIEWILEEGCEKSEVQIMRL